MARRLTTIKNPRSRDSRFDPWLGHSSFYFAISWSGLFVEDSGLEYVVYIISPFFCFLCKFMANLLLQLAECNHFKDHVYGMFVDLMLFHGSVDLLRLR
jgi:hypothetical protein